MPRNDIRIVRRVKVGGREFPVKRSLLSSMSEIYFEASAIQLRVMAYELRDFIVDKLLAYEPDKGELLVYRVADPQTNRPKDLPPEPKMRALREEEIYRPVRNDRVLLPRRYSKKYLKRKPFLYHPDLNKSYDRLKRKEGLDPRKLIATGDYIRGIVVRRKKSKKAGVYYAIVPANRKHKASTLSLKQLALIHEFGTSKYEIPLFGDPNNTVTIQVPPRPHWRPAMQELKRVFKLVPENVKAEAFRLLLEKELV